YGRGGCARLRPSFVYERGRSVAPGGCPVVRCASALLLGALVVCQRGARCWLDRSPAHSGSQKREQTHQVVRASAKVRRPVALGPGLSLLHRRAPGFTRLQELGRRTIAAAPPMLNLHDRVEPNVVVRT